MINSSLCQSEGDNTAKQLQMFSNSSY